MTITQQPKCSCVPAMLRMSSVTAQCKM